VFEWWRCVVVQGVVGVIEVGAVGVIDEMASLLLHRLNFMRELQRRLVVQLLLLLSLLSFPSHRFLIGGTQLLIGIQLPHESEVLGYYSQRQQDHTQFMRQLNAYEELRSANQEAMAREAQQAQQEQELDHQASLQFAHKIQAMQQERGHLVDHPHSTHLDHAHDTLHHHTAPPLKHKVTVQVNLHRQQLAV
jgi:hypothetical protein